MTSNLHLLGRLGLGLVYSSAVEKYPCQSEKSMCMYVYNIHTYTFIIYLCIPCHAMSCHVTPCQVMSCHVM